MKQVFYKLLLSAFTLAAVSAKAQIITTLAGSSLYGGDGGPATATSAPCNGIAVDMAGNIFISDPVNSVIRKIDLSGIISTVAGNGAAGYSGDGGAATNAQLSYPAGITIDMSGNLYVTDQNNSRIRKINTFGIVTTVAGNGVGGYSGDGGAATAAEIAPVDVAVDVAGNLYIADGTNDVVRKINTAGVITTIAGTGVYGYGGDGGPATAAIFDYVTGVAVDGFGNLYIADVNNDRIRKINASGIITTIAGNGTYGYSGDGGPATAAALKFAQYLSGLSVDNSGNLYITDGSNACIRKVNTAGIITTVAGIGTVGITTLTGYSGDGGPATAARLSTTYDVGVNAAGEIFIIDGGNKAVRKVNTAGIITTVAGNGGTNYYGDGGPAAAAGLSPWGIAADGSGSIYIGDGSNNVVRKIDAAGIITTVAGNGKGDFSGDGAPAIDAQLKNPYSVAVDNAGNLYIADVGNNRIRKVNAAGIITTYAGGGIAGLGNGGPATAATFSNFLGGLAFDDSGDLLVADAENGLIRKIDATGIITTIAGNGLGISVGDDGPATNVQMSYPYGIAVDGSGTMYIAEMGAAGFSKINPAGIMTTISGNGTWGCGGDDGRAVSAEVGNLMGACLDGSGNLFITDLYTQVIREINTSGIITRVAGTDTVAGYSGDGGPAMAAKLNTPAGAVFDRAGNLLIADAGNNRIRKVSGLPTAIKTVASAKNTLSVYPNPAAGCFTISADTKIDNGSVSIYNVTGQKVYSCEMSGTSMGVSLNAPPGVYMVLVNDGAQMYRTKLIIQ